MTYEKIFEELITLLKKVVNKPIYSEDNFSCPLTGEKMGFTSIDLLYVFLLISKHFNIQIDKIDVENYGFITIDSIGKIIYKKMNL